MHDAKASLRRSVKNVWILENGQNYRGLTAYPVFPGLRWNSDERSDLPCRAVREAMKAQPARPGELPQVLVKNQGMAAVLGWPGGRSNGRGSAVPVTHSGRRPDSNGVSTAETQSSMAPSPSNSALNLSNDLLAAYQQALPYVEHAIGLVLAVGKRLVACELFEQAQTAEHYWPRLIRARASQATTSSHQLPSEQANKMLKALENCAIEVFNSKGMGTDLRLRGAGLRGTALMFDDVLVHLSLNEMEA